MSTKNRVIKTLVKLHRKLEQEVPHKSMDFDDYLHQLTNAPELYLRNIFQLMNDMVNHYIPRGVNEYPNDPQSINYIKYDCSNLLVTNSENPFFADRLLANKLISVFDSLRQGVVQNKMLVFVGPPGSGKSTFLNNLLRRLEDFVGSDEGRMYETVWQIDTEKLGVPHIASMVEQESVIQNMLAGGKVWDANKILANKLIIPCPSHDHPIVQIPKEYRRDFLDEIITDKKFKKRLFSEKEFEWAFEETPCPICASIYTALSDVLSPEEIYSMLRARRYEFSRKLGDGVSVYNPGDTLYKAPLHNEELQKWLDSIFKSSNTVSYKYSGMAKTNNGVFVIMDAKSNNIERLQNIHGIISDGVHKVGTAEEGINSLFMTLINPADTDVIYKEKSFRDRIINIPIPYVRDYTTEVDILRNSYGKNINQAFMPRVLTAFAKAIVSSRLSGNAPSIVEWIQDSSKYTRFCDEGLVLLQMEIYCGTIPFWLSEEDKKNLTRTTRRKMIREGERQGQKGISGRESLEVFNTFIQRYAKPDDPITIEHIFEFFKEKRNGNKIDENFIPALQRQYDYLTLQDVKESMFFYNKRQISNEVKDYLFAINHDVDSEVESPYTGKKITTTENYFNVAEMRFLGEDSLKEDRVTFRNDEMRRYVSKTLSEVHVTGKLEKTAQFKVLQTKYNQNLKQNVLAPFVSNDNFRRGIKDYGTSAFKNYDKLIRTEVTSLMRNMKNKFGYTDISAQKACIYVIDNKLASQFK